MFNFAFHQTIYSILVVVRRGSHNRSAFSDGSTDKAIVDSVYAKRACLCGGRLQQQRPTAIGPQSQYRNGDA